MVRELIPAMASKGPINPEMVAILVRCSGPFCITSDTNNADPIRKKSGIIDALFSPFFNPGNAEYAPKIIQPKIMKSPILSAFDFHLSNAF